jgi:hypothetical protein
MFANLEGHRDPKQLLPISQFLAGGIGGMVSQYVDLYQFRCVSEMRITNWMQMLRLSLGYVEIVSFLNPDQRYVQSLTSV